MALTKPRNEALFYVDPDELILIGIDKRPGKDAPDGPSHFLYDAESIHTPLDPIKVQQIAVMGVKSPVAVRYCPDDREKLEVVFGRTRVRLCREANKLLAANGKAKHRIRCILESGSDADFLAMMIAENEVRRQTDSPLAKARKAEVFIGMGRTQQEAAIHFGTTQGAISQLLKLLKATPELQEAAERHVLSAAEVREAVDLPVQEQRERAKKAVEEAETAAKEGTSRRAKKTAASSKVNEAIRIRALSLSTKLDAGLKSPSRTVGVSASETAEIVAFLRFMSNQITKTNLLDLISVDLRGPASDKEDDDDDDDGDDDAPPSTDNEGRGH